MRGFARWVREHAGASGSADPLLPPYALDYFRHLQDRFRALPPGDSDPANRERCAAIIGAAADRSPAWGDLYTLELCLVRLTPDGELAMCAPGLRSRLRAILGDPEYEIVMGAAPAVGATDAAKLRREMEFVVGEVHRAYATTDARETNRTYLMSRVIVLMLGYIVFLLLVLGVAELVDTRWHNRAHSELIYTAFAAAVLGSLGGYVSLQSRLQSLPYEGDALFRMIAVNKGWLGVYLAPVSGSIFAVLAYMLFAAQLVKGDLVPEFHHYTAAELERQVPGIKSLANLHLNDMYDYPKLFLWSFLVGFAERYVPDALRRLVEGRRDKILGTFSPAAPPAPPPADPSSSDPPAATLTRPETDSPSAADEVAHHEPEQARQRDARQPLDAG